MHLSTLSISINTPWSSPEDSSFKQQRKLKVIAKTICVKWDPHKIKIECVTHLNTIKDNVSNTPFLPCALLMTYS